ncbi:site-specific DNA-methyltransferase [Mycoplasma miroungigenitalium]|uniref:Site-specific DNA-methyltransferase n=1 Tax=Mycoplasma miroungigenitalium TaxID=754515 RepID=A0A6M4JB77_9MOLU|nr:site-specific DNA-methyltransferase [Mycoplasma miroungigenitalium]QJR43246.1 site-specific DNA-methyltransferase [Mycoplasma miroungigenitalium]
MNKLLEEYLIKLDELPNTEFNIDQKILCKKLLQKVEDERDLPNVFQFLTQRVKTGFTFDIAPTVDSGSVAILKYDEHKSFINKLGGNDNTLIIGENYDALKNLLVIERESERGLEFNYDVIYIDPPYNTEASKNDGNSVANDKEFVDSNKFIYRDKYSRNGWLNMINERLRMAKDLLKEDGVIFVSIDDNEQAYLKVLMDEIFGEENFVANMINKTGAGRSDSKNIAIKKEYVLCYQKTNLFIANKKSSNIENYKYKDNNGFYSRNSFDRQGLRYSPSLDYEIIAPDGSKIYPGNSKEKWLDRQKNKNIERDWCWTLSKKEYKNRNDNGLIEWYKVNNQWRVAYKKYFDANDKSIPYSDLINDKSYNGMYEIKQIFNNRVFNYPKSIELIKYLLNLCQNKNARILDFFAGSGTTAHAVMELNREDGGNRTYTLVTNNENNIADEITYERLYRINNGKGTKGETFDWLKKNEPYRENLNVFNIVKYNTSINNTEDDNTKIKSIFRNSLTYFGISDNSLNNLDILRDLQSLEIYEKKA